MKRLATAAVAGLVALVGLVGAAPANAADGYGGATVIVKLVPSSRTVDEGDKFDFNYTAKTPTNHTVNCLTVKFKFNGQTNGSGTFTAPQVGSNTDRAISVTCYYEEDDVVTLGGGGGRVSASFATAIQSQSDSGIVHILNKGGNKDKDDSDDDDHNKNKDDDDDNGNLPNTGGERLAWLVIGLLLVAAGSTVVVSSRKRDSVA